MRTLKSVTPWVAAMAVAVGLTAVGGCSSSASKSASKAAAAKPAAKPVAKPVAKPAAVAEAPPPKPAPPPEDKNGDAYVQGQRYYTGDGVKQDYSKAADLFRTAAQGGHTYAQYSLALMYDHGYGLRRDMNEAAYWYRKASDGGDTRATSRLAAMGAVASGERLTSYSESSDVLISAPSMPAGTELIKRAESAAAPVPVPAPVIAPPVQKPAAAPAPVAAPTVTARRSPVVSTPVPPRTPVRKPAAAAAAPVPEPAPAPVAAPVSAPPVAAPAPAPVAAAPAAAPVAPPPPARQVMSALPVKQNAAQMSPMTAQAMSNYQSAMSTANYAMALRALELAREAGEIPALGLNEVQAAEELARTAIVAGDGNLAQVYLRQAAALGSALAADALNRLALNPDLQTISGFVNREAGASALNTTVQLPNAAPAPGQKTEQPSLMNRLFGGGNP